MYARTLIPTAFVIVITLLFAVTIGHNAAHELERAHVGSGVLYADYQKGLCDSKYVGYRAITGQLMVSCRIPKTHDCLVVFFKIMESGVPMGDKAYQQSAHVVECWKLTSLTAQYTDWLIVPVDVRAVITTMYGEP